MRDSDASDQFPHELLEYGSDVFFRAGLDLQFHYVSPNVERVLGWTPEEMIGHRVDDFVLHDDRATVQDGRFDEHGMMSVRGQVRRKNGAAMWFENHVLGVFDDQGTLAGFTGVFRDIDRQVLAEGEVRSSEERYRVLAEHASDVVVHADRDLVLQWASPSVKEVLGWSAVALAGQNVAVLLHEDDCAALEASNVDILAGRSAHFEARYRTTDGRWLWMSVVARPVLGPDGSVVGRISSWRDIDAEHSQREALRESEERFRMLAEHASDVVVQLDADGLLRWLSPSTEQILGHRISDLVGRRARDLVHPDDVEIVAAAQENASRGEGTRFEARYRRSDGSYIWMSVVGTSLFDEQGVAVGRVSSARNIDAERAAREALAASEEQFRFLVENAQDVVVRTHDGHLVFVSSSIQRVLGWSPEEVFQQAPEGFIHPDDWALSSHYRADAGGRTISNVRLRVRHRDGDYRWIELTARPVDMGDGHRNTVAVLRDVSERVGAEEALAAATVEAQAANLAKTTFLSRMSHELRTPLNAVLGFAQLLGMDPLSDDQRSAVEQILNGGRHLLELINEVLDIARIESGRMTLSPESVAAADVISECLDLVRPLALQHDVIIEHFDSAACSDHISVDRQRTIQILINLVTNAIKYNRPGGRVRVECEHSDNHPDRVVIAVADDGVGISAADLPKLFAPFERLGAARTSVEGTGIGLALSRGLAEMMQGDVTVESTEGVGSVFRLVVPRAEETTDDPALEGGSPIPNTAGAPRTVMYLEDNPANAMLMRSILARRGSVDLTVATRGVEALELLFASPPDLLVLDLHLPDIGGEEVLRRLRADRRTSTLPVVVLTADAAPHVRQHLMALGASAFLSKPVDVADVLSWIDDPWQGRRLR
jgi:PAS domain S-box-containing protein